jgi:hypothetical protein
VDYEQGQGGVYIIDCDNLDSYITVQMPTNYLPLTTYYAYQLGYDSRAAHPFSNGKPLCYVPVYDSSLYQISGENKNKRCGAILIVYEDGNTILSDERSAYIDREYSEWENDRIETDYGMVISWLGHPDIPCRGFPSYTEIYLNYFPTHPYLGTKYNLPSPITKTSSQTMRVTYTLTR